MLLIVLGRIEVGIGQENSGRTHGDRIDAVAALTIRLIHRLAITDDLEDRQKRSNRIGEVLALAYRNERALGKRKIRPRMAIHFTNTLRDPIWS